MIVILYIIESVQKEMHRVVLRFFVHQNVAFEGFDSQYFEKMCTTLCSSFDIICSKSAIKFVSIYAELVKVKVCIIFYSLLFFLNLYLANTANK